MVLIQKLPFFQLFFFRQYRPGKCFLRYSKTTKNAILVYKTRSSKSRKIDIFPKWLTHGFGPKMTIFPKRLTHVFGLKKSFFPTFLL